MINLNKENNKDYVGRTAYYEHNKKLLIGALELLLNKDEKVVEELSLRKLDKARVAYTKGTVLIDMIYENYNRVTISTNPNPYRLLRNNINVVYPLVYILSSVKLFDTVRRYLGDKENGVDVKIPRYASKAMFDYLDANSMNLDAQYKDAIEIVLEDLRDQFAKGEIIKMPA